MTLKYRLNLATGDLEVHDDPTAATSDPAEFTNLATLLTALNNSVTHEQLTASIANFYHKAHPVKVLRNGIFSEADGTTTFLEYVGETASWSLTGSSRLPEGYVETKPRDVEFFVEPSFKDINGETVDRPAAFLKIIIHCQKQVPDHTVKVHLQRYYDYALGEYPDPLMIGAGHGTSNSGEMGSGS